MMPRPEDAKTEKPRGMEPSKRMRAMTREAPI
jgi:hypothetical protein